MTDNAEAPIPFDVLWGSVSDVLLRRAATYIASREKSSDRAVRMAAKSCADELARLAVDLRPLAVADARERMAKADKAVTVTGYWEDDPAAVPE